jgi:hypothetical protein
MQTFFKSTRRKNKTSSSGNVTGYDDDFEVDMAITELNYKIVRTISFKKIRIVECYSPYGFLCYVVSESTVTSRVKVSPVKDTIGTNQLKSLIHIIGNRASGVMINRKTDACLIWETKAHHMNLIGPHGIHPVITLSQLMQYPEESLTTMNELYCLQRMEITNNRLEHIEDMTGRIPGWLDEALDRLNTLNNQINNKISSDSCDADELRKLQLNREAICDQINQVSEALDTIDQIISQEE